MVLRNLLYILNQQLCEKYKNWMISCTYIVQSHVSLNKIIWFSIELIIGQNFLFFKFMFIFQKKKWPGKTPRWGFFKSFFIDLKKQIKKCCQKMVKFIFNLKDHQCRPFFFWHTNCHTQARLRPRLGRLYYRFWQ